MYDEPRVTQYRATSIDFGGASAVTFTIAVPDETNGTQGRAGRVLAVRLENVTELFPALTTLASSVQVGDGSDADKYYDTGNIVSVAVNENITEYPDDGAQVDIELGRSTLTVTCNVNTGGTPTGIADVIVEVAWY